MCSAKNVSTRQNTEDSYPKAIYILMQYTSSFKCALDENAPRPIHVDKKCICMYMYITRGHVCVTLAAAEFKDTK
jgi:hypothetical protein